MIKRQRSALSKLLKVYKLRNINEKGSRASYHKYTKLFGLSIQVFKCTSIQVYKIFK